MDTFYFVYYVVIFFFFLMYINAYYNAYFNDFSRIFACIFVCFLELKMPKPIHNVSNDMLSNSWIQQKKVDHIHIIGSEMVELLQLLSRNRQIHWFDIMYTPRNQYSNDKSCSLHEQRGVSYRKATTSCGRLVTYSKFINQQCQRFNFLLLSYVRRSAIQIKTIQTTSVFKNNMVLVLVILINNNNTINYK
jgi:hypothetical protein